MRRGGAFVSSVSFEMLSMRCSKIGVIINKIFVIDTYVCELDYPIEINASNQAGCALVYLRGAVFRPL